VKGKSLYSGRQFPIPWPEFYVLYNSHAPYPDNVILRLSDLFEKPQFLGLPENAKPLLDLEVRVININEGRNNEIVKRCKKLSEYSKFVAISYKNLKEFRDKEKAIKETVKYCQKYDIIKEFLKIHGSEVLNMLLTDWNLEDAKEVWQEEAREDGLEEGLKKGLEKGQAEGLEKGQVEGRENERKYILSLLDEGLSAEEIKNRLISK